MTMEEIRGLLGRIAESDNLTDDMREDIRKAIDSADESIGAEKRFDSIDAAIKAFYDEFVSFRRDYVDTAINADSHARDARRDGRDDFRPETVERKDIFEEVEVK